MFTKHEVFNQGGSVGGGPLAGLEQFNRFGGGHATTQATEEERVYRVFRKRQVEPMAMFRRGQGTKESAERPIRLTSYGK